MRTFTICLAFLLLSTLGAQAADKPNYKDLVIASGASVSSILDMSTITPGNGSALGLFMPSTWTAASITVLVSPTCDTPWYNAYDGAGNEYTISAAAAHYVGLDSAYFIGVRCIKLVSGTAATPVNQAGTRVVKVGYGRFNQ